MAADALAVLDEEGNEIMLDVEEADALTALTDCLDAATVSACPSCRSRVVACVAVVDVIDAAPPFARSTELASLADDAPTPHLYLDDLGSDCRHERWRDPGHAEWADVLGDLASDRRAR